jgi:hypothetical protein
MTSMNLENNDLSGTIPPAVFARLGALSYLDLSMNNFSGTVPSTVT